MSNYPNAFQRRFAIRMPNGLLYGQAPIAEAVPDYSQSSAMRDMEQMARMIMGVSTPATKAPQVLGPQIFDTAEAAEAQLKLIRDAAASVGVTTYGGCVVEQLCTPFTSGDPSVDFAQQIIEWTRENGGQP